jgi:hypothetical protein
MCQCGRRALLLKRAQTRTRFGESADAACRAWTRLCNHSRSLRARSYSNTYTLLQDTVLESQSIRTLPKNGEAYRSTPRAYTQFI